MTEHTIPASATIHHGGEYMRLYANGCVGRTIPGASNYGQPSFNWRITGAQEYDNFGRPSGLHYSLEDVLYTKIEWKWKNGNQRVHITDYDHGTHRVWMSPKHEVYPLSRPDLLNPVRPWNNLMVCFKDTPVQVSGPYPKASYPYGAPTLPRLEWFIKWQTWEIVAPPEPETLEGELPEFNIAHLIQYVDQARVIVGNSWPIFEAETLDAMIRRLVVKGEQPKMLT